jgi:hypothetical protein
MPDAPKLPNTPPQPSALILKYVAPMLSAYANHEILLFPEKVVE